MGLQASLQVKQLIFRLLQRDPKKRLGCLEGANEVKNHPYFKGINWALIRCTVTSQSLFTCERRKYIYIYIYFVSEFISICRLLRSLKLRYFPAKLRRKRKSWILNWKICKQMFFEI